jgi:hypothetical protein
MFLFMEPRPGRARPEKAPAVGLGIERLAPLERDPEHFQFPDRRV